MTDKSLEIVLEDESIPPRSAFVAFKPQGVGGGEVESLWSYLFRVAVAHGVTLYVLLYRLMPESLVGTGAQITKAKTEFYQHYCSSRINSPLACGKLLERIQGRLPIANSELEMLSSVPMSNVLTDHGMIRENRAWCAQCYSSDSVPYDRLAWSWKDVRYCSRHNARLSEACPSCSAKQRFRGTGTGIANCEECGVTLAQADVEEKVENLYDLHTADVAAKVIEMGQKGLMVSELVEHFWSNIRFLAEAIGGSHLLSKRLGYGRTTLFEICRSRRTPNILLLAKVTWTGRISAEEFLTRKVVFGEIAEPAEWGAVRDMYRPRGEVDSGAVIAALLDLMRQNPYRLISNTTLCLAAKVSRKHPAFRFPYLRDLMIAQRAAAKAARHAHFTWKYCTRIRKAISMIEAAGGTPCAARLNRTLIEPGVLKGDLARRIRDGFLRAIGTGRREVLKRRDRPEYLSEVGKWIN